MSLLSGTLAVTVRLAYHAMWGLTTNEILGRAKFVRTD
jgi:hypothetical protein